ncbi:T9SS type A sorting domain-containing protein [Flavobacterium sp.]|uniref:T9SS type A sorting domain-containing protein n=1 Tax=Flavobacterium sp. TaxID=239 RepID=UPI00286EB3B6|nr:T9SS type A sorting domain-containing protein [Flavobacterium sp.]
MKKNYFAENLNKSFLTLSVIFCALFANPSFAQKNIGWTGATNNNWSTPTNWNYPAITSVGTFGNNKPTITLTEANTDIAVGDKVSGYGIPAGATVTEIDATQTIITISANTWSGVGTPGTNVCFTFATPKMATGAPTIVDIALIGNGGNPTLAPGSYYLGGLTISNEKGAITGSTLTIGPDVEVFIETLTNEGILLKGGNIVNNGLLDVKSSLLGGTTSSASAYGMSFAIPSVVPTVPTEYTYSGNGTLKIDTSAGNFTSGGIFFVTSSEANAANATYKVLFDGTLSLLLSTAKAANGNANTPFIKTGGVGLPGCKLILGGAGFDLGDSFTGSLNGLIGISGGGVDVTVAQGTTINVYGSANSPMGTIGMYVYGSSTATLSSSFTNKGTINILGTMLRNPIGASAQNYGVVNLINDGTFNIDVKSIASSTAISINNNQGATQPAEVNIINNGTFSIKILLNGRTWGSPIVMTTFSGAPNLHVDNRGTFNFIGSNYLFGAKVFNPSLNPPPVTDPPTAAQTGASRITNSGTINTNQEFRAFYTVNTSTGKINFASTADSPLKIATFTVAATVAAAAGTTYTDSNSNVYTVVVDKIGGTGTSLITNVTSNAVNPPTIAASVGPPVVAASALTKTGLGSGDSSIIYTFLVTNNFNASFAPLLNSGVLNTNAGTTLLTGITGFTSPDATSVLSPGGNTKNGIVSFAEVTGDSLTLRGTLKIGANGSTTPGIDFDQLKMTGGLDIIDISAATLDLTGIYIPTTITTLDIITTNTTLDFEGAVVGEFASEVGVPKGWKVMYAPGLGSKVQLYFDPALSAPQFADAKFSYYPNPTRSQLNITAAKNISKVELFNLLGQKVQSNTVNASQKQLDISSLQNGVYLMEVTIDKAKQSFKVVKQ